MNKHSVVELEGREKLSDPLSELLRAGVKQLIHQAVEVELQGFLSIYAQRRTAEGMAGVIRNGYLPEREVQSGMDR